MTIVLVLSLPQSWSSVARAVAARASRAVVNFMAAGEGEIESNQTRDTLETMGGGSESFDLSESLLSNLNERVT